MKRKRTEEQWLQATGLVGHLHAIRKKAAVLPPSHPYVAAGIGELHVLLKSALQDDPTLHLSVIERELYLDGRLMTRESLTYSALIDDLTERGISSLSIEKGLRLKELTDFISLSLLKPAEIEAAGGWKNSLKGKRVTHLDVGPIQVTMDPVTGETGDEDGYTKQDAMPTAPEKCYDNALEAVAECFSGVRDTRRVGLSFAKNVAQLLISTLMDDASILQSMTHIKGQHEYTFFHSVNVAILSILMGIRLNFRGDLLDRLGTAALLHDVGKMRIPVEILDGKTTLTDDQWGIMKSHSIEGLRFLSTQKDVDPLCHVVAVQHHGRYDLGGYPSFEDMKNLHFLSNIVALADVYDALTSDRAYRKAMLPDRAMKLIIDGIGTHFHPALGKLFVHMAGLYPVGSVVELNTGETGVVLKPNPDDLLRPEIKLRTPQEDGRIVQLNELNDEGLYRRSILHAIDPSQTTA
jgi:HD-GYP domain-containing protein (c-di-GMP phosphodiesterase class II)